MQEWTGRFFAAVYLLGANSETGLETGFQVVIWENSAAGLELMEIIPSISTEWVFFRSRF